MKCQNRFCIYFEQYRCILPEIEVGVIGECLRCEYVSIDERVLRSLRERVLGNSNRVSPLYNDDKNDN